MNANLLLSAPLAALALSAVASAAVVFTDDFETPDVTAANSDGFTNGQVGSNWVKNTQGFGATRQGNVDESHGDFTDPVGEQAFAFRYTNSGITTVPGAIGVLTLGDTYTVTFDVVEDGHNAGTPYSAGLFTFNGGARNAMNGAGISQNTTKQLNVVSGNSSGTTYTQVSFSFTPDPVADAAVLGQDVALRFQGATDSAIIDNVTVDVTSAVVPEPSSLLLATLSALGLFAKRRP